MHIDDFPRSPFPRLASPLLLRCSTFGCVLLFTNSLLIFLFAGISILQFAVRSPGRIPIISFDWWTDRGRVSLDTVTRDEARFLNVHYRLEQKIFFDGLRLLIDMHVTG